MTQVPSSRPLSVRQIAASIEPGPNKAVLGCCDQREDITLGFFFDGTGMLHPFDVDQEKKDAAWVPPDEATLQRRDALYTAEREQAKTELEQRMEAEQQRAEQEGFATEANRHRVNALMLEQTVEEARIRREDWRAPDRRRSEEWDNWREKNSKANAAQARAEEAERQSDAARKANERLSAERNRLEEIQVWDSPGKSSTSNVARLFFLYSRERHIRREYIRGVGVREADKKKNADENTKSDGENQKDPPVEKEESSLGQAFALGSEGGEARITEATEAVLEELRKLLPCPPKSVTIDIFGFSRGAALARHFVNVIQAGLPDLSKKPVPVSSEESDKTLQPFGNMLGEYTFVPEESTKSITQKLTGIYPRLPNVTIRFVGLFDTVGSFYWPGNKDEGIFKLRLEPGCATKIVHLVAADERRKNFPCTSVAGSGGEEIIMAGVHSDIGGGYKRSEQKWLVMDREMYTNAPFLDGLSGAKAMLLQRAQAHGLCVDGVLSPGYFLENSIIPTPSPISIATTGILYLLRAKITDNRYATVPLRIMYKKATASGVPFTSVEKSDKPERYQIPADLQGYVANPPQTLPAEHWERYQHVSAVDMAPVTPYLPRPLGRYEESRVDQLSLALDENPTGPRRYISQ